MTVYYVHDLNFVEIIELNGPFANSSIHNALLAVLAFQSSSPS